jgi:erythromycin esterase-like protein
MEITISYTVVDVSKFVDWMRGKGFKAQVSERTTFQGVDAQESALACDAIRVLWKWYGDEMGQD